jgi:hypothetical protein
MLALGIGAGTLYLLVQLAKAQAGDDDDFHFGGGV